jgi:hypothetical protein
MEWRIVIPDNSELQLATRSPDVVVGDLACLWANAVHGLLWFLPDDEFILFVAVAHECISTRRRKGAI